MGRRRGRLYLLRMTTGSNWSLALPRPDQQQDVPQVT